MRAITGELLRRRPWVGLAGSLVLHLALIVALVWIRPPVGRPDVKRGEPLFVELPKSEEAALRGSPGAPGPEPAKPAPPAAKPAPAVAKPAPAPRAAPKPAAARPPAPPAVAKAAPAAPLPKEERAPEPAKPEPVKPAPVKPEVPAEKPAVAEAKAAEPAVGPPPAPRVASVPPAPDLRSLRPGAPGTGGAGGRGEGRAGIEGEPVPLDSKDPKYSDYLDRVRRMIKEKWAYPCVKDPGSGRCDYMSTSLVIEFGILKDGRVPFVIVRRQSDYDIYDEYAVNAIKLASPFPPVPESLAGGRRGIPILANFSYIVESSLTNLLR